MKAFVLELKCDSAAFADDCGFELGLILRLVAGRAENDLLGSEMILRDTNGNRVGYARFVNTEG